jgi:hypothetical protein
MSAIRLFKENPDTHKREALGTITENQLDFLIENLEEEFEEDEEYFLTRDTVDYLREQGADSNLLAMLEQALAGTQDGIDVSYVSE